MELLWLKHLSLPSSIVTATTVVVVSFTVQVGWSVGQPIGKQVDRSKSQAHTHCSYLLSRSCAFSFSILQESMRFRHTPLHAGTLEVEDADLSAEDIRTAYRQAAWLGLKDLGFGATSFQPNWHRCLFSFFQAVQAEMPKLSSLYHLCPQKALSHLETPSGSALYILQGPKPQKPETWGLSPKLSSPKP